MQPVVLADRNGTMAAAVTRIRDETVGVVGRSDALHTYYLTKIKVIITCIILQGY